jgi:outer membrane protein assembly factor BamA
VADSLRRSGYYFAEIDSITRSGVRTVAHLSRGPIVHIGELDLVGLEDAERDGILRLMETRQGTVFDLDRLERDLQSVLIGYEHAGRLLAEAEVEDLRLISEDPPQVAIKIRVAAGPQVPLKRIELPGAERTKPSFVAMLAGLEIGRPLTEYDPDALRRRLEDSALFESVGELELVVESDTAAVLRVPLAEVDPGSFDLVFGYLPPQTQGVRGTFIGTGHLTLNNLFGRGRSIAIKLNRLPNQASSMEASASDPFLFGRPLGVEIRFNGHEQDSTFGKQAYRGELAYRFPGGLGVFGGFSREVTRPGQAGLRIAGSGRQVVPRSDAWFLGIGIRFSRLDRSVNPTTGFLLETNLETGRKERSERRIVEADTTRDILVLRQERLQVTGRAFVPTLSRQVLVFGGDAAILVSNEYDRSDLFRFGGATSLRGYDEDRFVGRIVARALLEYRFLIDRVSFAYAFLDVGFVDRPETPELSADQELRPGYGLGIQFRTVVGLVNVSAAINPESGPTDARIHAGLSFGL